MPTRKKVGTENDDHRCFWQRRWHREGKKQVFEDVWFCRFCGKTSANNPFKL